MTPRRYRQTSRAAAAEQTRERIIEAAIVEYRERGVLGASMQSIAARADVSRGTVINHFGDLDGLLAAVIEAAMSSIELPDESVFDGATGRDDRAHRFAEAMLRFYDRTQDWWRVFADERDELPALPAIRAGEQQFWEVVGKLQQSALGDLSTHPSVVGAMSVLVGPGTIPSITAVGLTVDEAVALAADLFTEAVHRAERISQVGDRRVS